MEPDDQSADETTRYEEALRLEKRTIDAGTVRVRKEVSSEHIRTPVQRKVEHMDSVDRAAPNEQDSGQIETLPDGSVSIPIFEEQLVITKRLVVRERVIVRKSSTTESQVVEADLRIEHVHVDVAEPPGA